MSATTATTAPRLPSPAVITVLAAAAISMLVVSACDSRSGPHVVLHGSDGQVKVGIELALTAREQAKGLMWRESMAEDHGMLFVFKDSRPRSFWMKNTPLPLDIVYIDDGRIVSIAENTTPYSTRSIPSGAPARYVLEVNGGFCKRHGVAAGAPVEMVGLGDAVEEAHPSDPDATRAP